MFGYGKKLPKRDVKVARFPEGNLNMQFFTTIDPVSGFKSRRGKGRRMLITVQAEVPGMIYTQRKMAIDQMVPGGDYLYSIMGEKRPSKRTGKQAIVSGTTGSKALDTALPIALNHFMTYFEQKHAQQEQDRIF